MYRLIRTLRAAFLFSTVLFLGAMALQARADLAYGLRVFAQEAQAHGNGFVAQTSVKAADAFEIFVARIDEWLKVHALPPLPMRGTQNEGGTPDEQQPDPPAPKIQQEQETEFAYLAPAPEPLAPTSVTGNIITPKPQRFLEPVGVADNLKTVAKAPVLPSEMKPVTVAENVKRVAKVQTGEKKAARVAKAPSIAPDAVQGGAETARLVSHVRESLSREMYTNFDLFLYVSKAKQGEGAGPWAQRLYVLVKNEDGLSLVREWSVSTGREQVEYNKRGERLPSFTPAGYYQLDPGRFYKGYRSSQWDADMPFAMFFNWVERGIQTGLAIHGAGTEAEIALLGQRASAGCIRLAPEHAKFLFNTIKNQYRGSVPRFAYDTKTKTISNRGEFARGKNGALRFQDGYRALVIIEDNDGKVGGNDVS